MRKTATYRTSHLPFRHRAVWAFALAAALVCSAPLRAGQAALSSLPNQGYLFLHPMFDAVPWKTTLERLDLILPDTLAAITVKSFAVSRGSDNAVAVFTDANGGMFVMPVLYEKLMAPCYDHALTFDAPRRVVAPGFSFNTMVPLHVVRDSLYAGDSVRVALSSSAQPLRLLVAVIGSPAATVLRIDTIVCAERRANQRITGIFGASDSATGKDLGLWITGTNGLVRYIPYTNHRFGSEAVRDLGEATVSVTHTSGTVAVTSQGRIFRRNPADTFFTFAVTASGALRRVYPQGAIGDNGLFKEFAANVWRADRTMGGGSLRHAHFIRRPGGLGVELLDTLWQYTAATYRDSSSRIAATLPASLASNINGLPYVYTGLAPLDITVMLDDPDSNFSDYTLTHVSGLSSVDLKNDGTYAIAPLSDSASCHIGSITMTSGRVRLTLSGTQFTVQHDCGLGALDPTCQACYWKKYDFKLTRTLRASDTIRLRTGQHLLRIACPPSTVAMYRVSSANPGGALFTVRFASGYRHYLALPDNPQIHPVAIAIHDLQGKNIHGAQLHCGQQSLDLPRVKCRGIVIISCRLSDGSTVTARVPVPER